jgi:hypothetical protein
MTIHKSQGSTLDQVIVDLGQRESSGLTFVALSRVRTSGSILVEPVDDDRLLRCNAGGRLAERLAEEKRLQLLSDMCLQSYPRLQSGEQWGDVFSRDESNKRTVTARLALLAAGIAATRAAAAASKAEKAQRKKSAKKKGKDAVVPSDKATKKAAPKRSTKKAGATSKDSASNGKMTIIQLRAALCARGVKQSGLKSELEDRWQRTKKSLLISCDLVLSLQSMPAPPDGDVSFDIWRCHCAPPAESSKPMDLLNCEDCGVNAPHAFYVCVCGKKNFISDIKCGYSMCAAVNPNYQPAKTKAPTRWGCSKRLKLNDTTSQILWRSKNWCDSLELKLYY